MGLHKTCKQMFIAAFLIIAQKMKQPKCPLSNEWMNIMWYFHTIECYLSIKKNEIWIYPKMDESLTHYDKWRKPAIKTIYYKF